MAGQEPAPKRRQGPETKTPRKLSVFERLLQKLASKRRRLQREDPNIYPLF